MTALYILVTVVQTLVISLGIGAATISLLNFLTATKDQEIEVSERNLMSATASVKNFAFILLILTSLVQSVIIYLELDTAYFSPIAITAWVAVLALIVVQLLIRTNSMPGSFLAALEIASWYTLGILIALISMRLTEFTIWQFLFGYVVVIAMSVFVTSLFIARSRTDNQNQSTQ